MDYIFDAAPQVTLPIVGSDQFYPVRRVFCVGRNYAEHAREMGHDPATSPPFFFEKHPSCVVAGDGVLDFPYPSGSNDVHHEIELVVALKSGGKDLDISAAKQAVYGYAVGIDFTRRDLQAEAKKLGRPWATAKSFDFSAPISALVPAENISELDAANIWLKNSGKTVQQATIGDMIWGVEASIAYLSTLFELHAGDIIMTGTPAGVAAVTKGDTLEGGIDGIGAIEVRCV